MRRGWGLKMTETNHFVAAVVIFFFEFGLYCGRLKLRSVLGRSKTRVILSVDP